MGIIISPIIVLVLLLIFFFFLSCTSFNGQIDAAAAAASKDHLILPIKRSDFPSGFIFGAGSSTYQSEGAAYMYGKGPSIWDTFTKQYPEKIWDRSTGDVADDLYHRYKEDIKLMKEIGLDSFRFSISWSRILPTGKISGGVNPKGVAFYNSLINQLLANGIKPFVTLFHWDVPQGLEDDYGGFLSPYIVDDFGGYVDLCFKTFGDRVKYWVTLNEPLSFTVRGYEDGVFAPGRCSKYVGNCSVGNSATEPYLVAHHLLLSHAVAVKIYKQKYQAKQKGQIGITIVTNWFEPKYNTIADRKAAARAQDFYLGWFADPVTYGEYPKVMRSIVGDRLPKFTRAESDMLRESFDFLGLNYYTTNYVSYVQPVTGPNISYTTDMQASLTTSRNGLAIGTPTALNWLFICPKGIQDLMLYVKTKYKNPPIFITENGLAYANNESLPLKDALKDGLRIRYMSLHLKYLQQSIKMGANVKAYYSWSTFDDFEWNAGYTVRFGLIYIDFKNHLKRYLKYSAYWYKMFLKA